MSFEKWRGAPPCARCGLKRWFSIFCRDCLESMTLGEALNWEARA